MGNMSAYVVLCFVYWCPKDLSAHPVQIVWFLFACSVCDVFCADLSHVRLKPVLRVMDGEDDPRVQVILFEGDQHSELILASQLLNHLL